MWSFSISLCLCVLVTVAADNIRCSFPEYLTRRSRWETGIVKEHIRTNGFFKFHKSKVEISHLETSGIESWACESPLPDNKFLLKSEHTEGGKVEFICMQFIERTEYVVQRKISAMSDSAGIALCKDENLTLDDWPLVWPDIDDDYSECPFLGGYAFDIHDNIHDEPLCEDWLKPRLESECIRGEGITVDFRNPMCIGDLGMEMVQKLSCLGSWHDGDYIFTILTDQDDLWEKLWLMRITKDPDNEDSFVAVLSMDIVADRSTIYGNNELVPTERIFKLKLTTEIYPSLCENEAEVCEDDGMCNSENNVFCQKECDICDKNKEFHECHFDDETRGEWIEIRETQSKDITVTDNMLYAADLNPFHCYELYADGFYEGSGRRALATIFNNGCKPRFTCAEFQSKSPDVMTYRLSQSSIWPMGGIVNAESVCNDKIFKNDKQPLQALYRNKHPKVLIKKENKNHQHTYVPCNLNVSLGLHGFSNDGKNLLGVLWNAVVGHEEGSSDTLLHESCVNGEEKDETRKSPFHSSRLLKCMASYREGDETQFIVLKEQDNPLNIECWVIHQNEWDLDPKLYVLHPAECNSVTPHLVEFFDSDHFIAKYELREVEKDVMDPCSLWMKNTLKDRNSSTIENPDQNLHPTKDLSDTQPVPDDSKSNIPDNWSIRIGGLTSRASQISMITGLTLFWMTFVSVLLLK